MTKKYQPFEFDRDQLSLDLSIAANPLAAQLRRAGMGLSPAPLLQLQKLIDAHQLLFREALLTERETAVIRRRLRNRILSELRQHGRKVAPL